MLDSFAPFSAGYTVAATCWILRAVCSRAGVILLVMSWWSRLIYKRRRGRVKLLVEQRLGESLAKTIAYLLIIFVAHTAAMVKFEGMSVGDGLWLTLTTVTTVGYGDVSAATLWGRTATALLLYTGGIFVLAKLAGDYFEYRADRRERMARGEWEWDMQDHIVIINSPDEEPENYFQRLIGEFRNSEEYADTPVQLLTSHFAGGLPANLAAFENVVHYSGDGHNNTTLEAVNINAAAAVIVLSLSDHDPTCDAQTFDTLYRLRELGVRAPVLAECVLDANRARFYEAGAKIVIRPIRVYPGMVVRGFIAPGIEQVIEELFRSDGGEYRRYDVAVTGLRWATVVSALVENNLGVAVAYESTDGGDIITSPEADEVITASALFVMSRLHLNDINVQVTAALSHAS
jgi:voltage-gated potassium channel